MLSSLTYIIIHHDHRGEEGWAMGRCPKMGWGSGPCWTHLPQEPPLGVVEEAEDCRDDDSALSVLGHILEDGGQDQQDNHHQQRCTIAEHA